jgi:hypothetical protein
VEEGLAVSSGEVGSAEVDSAGDSAAEEVKGVVTAIQARQGEGGEGEKAAVLVERSAEEDSAVADSAAGSAAGSAAAGSAAGSVAGLAVGSVVGSVAGSVAGSAAGLAAGSEVVMGRSKRARRPHVRLAPELDTHIPSPPLLLRRQMEVAA